MARIRGLRLGIRAAMTAIATAILIFLLWHVLTNGVEPAEVPLDAHQRDTLPSRAADDHHPSWGFLGLLGLVGGGPTFLGTVLGYAWVSEALQVLFFALAAGSILYVVMELVSVCRRFSMPTLVTWMILLGIMLGFGTDFVLSAVGA